MRADRRPPTPPGASLAERFPLAARARRLPPAVPRTAGGEAAADATPRPAPRAAVRPWYRGNWPLYAFVFLLPLQNIQVGYLPNFGGGLNFLNLMFIASLVGAFVQGGRLATDEPVNRWVLAYIVYAVISLFVSYQTVSDTESHFNILKDHLLGVCVVFLVQMSVRDWSDVRRMLLFTLLPLPYIAKVTWAQHLSVSSWHYSDDLRITGTFALLGANEFAAFCVTVMVMLTGLLIGAKAKWTWKAMLVGGIACMLLGVLYSYSRTGYVSAILGVLTVVLVWRGRWKMVLPLLLVAAIAPPLLPPSVVERFDSTSVEADKRDESTELRFEFWQLAWDNFTAHPITGTGFQSFRHKEINPFGMDTHNFYMRTLTEGGLLGVFVTLGLFIAVLRTAVRELKSATTGTWRYALALGLCGVWTGLVISNLFGDRFTYYPMIAYFWLYVALVMKARHLPAEGAWQRPR